MATYTFSPNKAFDALGVKDHAVSIKGFVDGVKAPEKKGEDFLLFKFVISNGQRRIACLIWHKISTNGVNLIERYQNKITINQVIYIDAAYCKESKFPEPGCIRQELVIGEGTRLDFKGVYKMGASVAGPPTIVTLPDIASVNGRITVTGFIRTPFFTQSNVMRNSQSQYASITDSKVKVNICVARYTPNADIVRGREVKVTGILRNTNDGAFVLDIQSMNDIVVNLETPLASEEFLDEGVCTPKRKRDYEDDWLTYTILIYFFNLIR